MVHGVAQIEQQGGRSRILLRRSLPLSVRKLRLADLSRCTQARLVWLVQRLKPQELVLKLQNLKKSNKRRPLKQNE